jgi:hypothetical protein
VLHYRKRRHVKLLNEPMVGAEFDQVNALWDAMWVDHTDAPFTGTVEPAVTDS